MWNAGGEDIYYQGKSKEELPVSVKLTYYLDGKEISLMTGGKKRKTENQN